ncbi:MAG: 4Fe-4S binding protein [Kiritimatiellia bacterium]|jgi:Ni,Fe-hydrogenase III small subunit/Pyruvate/2-oxoacid:ferredoxin oxidoreductase delta subunit
MLKTLHARLKQGHRTGTFPRTEPNLPDRFLGRPVIASDATADDAAAAAAVCPVGAVLVRDGQPAIDTGRCIFCARCAEACPRITFSKQHRLAAFTREDLVVRPGPPAPPAGESDPEFRKLCGRSFKIRQVSAGGCAACELDFNVLGTLAWDLGRFGIQVVASPRHADAVLVTGPVTDNMLLALRKTHAAMPRPSWVVACGACAISGGVYSESPTAAGGLDDVLKPDLYIPGCPPHPSTILEGLLRMMKG